MALPRLALLEHLHYRLHYLRRQVWRNDAAIVGVRLRLRAERTPLAAATDATGAIESWRGRRNRRRRSAWPSRRRSRRTCCAGRRTATWAEQSACCGSALLPAVALEWRPDIRAAGVVRISSESSAVVADRRKIPHCLLIVAAHNQRVVETHPAHRLVDQLQLLQSGKLVPIRSDFRVFCRAAPQGRSETLRRQPLANRRIR